MNLTKKEAIESHRKMWNWIAVMLKSKRYKAFENTECGTTYRITILFLKYAYINMIGLNGKVTCNCFCCEYVFKKKWGHSCDDCLLVWNERSCVGGEYGVLNALEYTPENLPKAVELALKIATLPEKEELLYATYEESERTLPGEKDIRSLEEWKEYYEKYVDSDEFPDFECWLENNIRLGNLIKENV